MEHLTFECEHTHKDGHKMIFTWKNGIVMTVCFDIKKIVITRDGEVKNSYSAEDLMLDEFMGIIEECQKIDDQLAN